MRDPTYVEEIARIAPEPKQKKEDDNEWNFDMLMTDEKEPDPESMTAFGLVRRIIKGRLTVCMVEGSSTGKLYLREADN